MGASSCFVIDYLLSDSRENVAWGAVTIALFCGLFVIRLVARFDMIMMVVSPSEYNAY